MAEGNATTCKGCGQPFAPTRKGNTFCTQTCWRKWKWKAINKQKPLAPRPCDQCEKSFVPVRKWMKFCSAVCRDKSHEHPWGHAKRGDGETEREFKDRLRRYDRHGLNNWVKKHRAAGICRACTKPVMPGTNCWCERHWFWQAAWRNGLKGKGSAARAKALLETQNFTCPYTKRKLVVGVNASLDHANPRSRFPDQVSDWNNVEWVDLDVNRAKRALTKAEFIALCKVIAERK